MEHFLQEQISDKVLENISRDERNIYEELQKRLWDERNSYYENSLYFQELLGKMFLNGQDKIVESNDGELGHVPGQGHGAPGAFRETFLGIHLYGGTAAPA